MGGDCELSQRSVSVLCALVHSLRALGRFSNAILLDIKCSRAHTCTGWHMMYAEHSSRMRPVCIMSQASSRVVKCERKCRRPWLFSTYACILLFLFVFFESIFVSKKTNKLTAQHIFPLHSFGFWFDIEMEIRSTNEQTHVHRLKSMRNCIDTLYTKNTHAE